MRLKKFSIGSTFKVTAIAGFVFAAKGECHVASTNSTGSFFEHYSAKMVDGAKNASLLELVEPLGIKGLKIVPYELEMVMKKWPPKTGP